ncbi:Dimethylaniline monooxygenase [Cladophialophora carrionii]|uniref:Dimethylaniline monooxygenase n=1 Tax=Cladophialophora carrionii TaxID=86049 RepID=A0A1C1CUS3_9EURO|nr:Dimethylaniline monooxygenase [Cladophialophora carrionii]
MRVAIIGAGPGGLVTLKYLLEASQRFHVAPIEAKIFEAQDGIGGTFRYRTYPEGEMVSSKFLTTFSDFRIPKGRFPSGDNDFLQLEEYVDYLEDYADHFKLRPHINLNTKVTNVRRAKGGKGHVVTYTSPGGRTEEWACDAVAVCTGLHVETVVPDIPGIEKVPTVLHSSQYKSREIFKEGSNVVILGVGETAMDMAYFAVTSPVKTVTLSHRGGFVLAPKHVERFVVNGEQEPEHNASPVDTNWNSLFDTAYAHPKLRNHRWQWLFYDWWTKGVWVLLNNTRYGYGQHAGIIKGYHMSEVLFVKSTRIQPYFNRRYHTYGNFGQWKNSKIDLPRIDQTERSVEFAPWPEYIDDEGVIHFQKNDSLESKYIETVKIKPDVMIFATGYSHLSFPFLSPGYPDSRDANVRSLWKEGDETVGFIGFIRPQLGAIPPLAEFQAQLWILRILNLLPESNLRHLSPSYDPDAEEWYKLKPRAGARVRHGVDHESYAYQLALDMGAAPSIVDVLKCGRKVFIAWAFGANFNTKFRLVGPWKWDGAAEIMRTEMYELITRRPVFWGHIMLNALPMAIFGPLSLLYWIYFTFYAPFLKRLGLGLSRRPPKRQYIKGHARTPSKQV